jgi:hypothetical protein
MTVYFVKCQEYVKIGHSTKPMSRIADLQTSSPYPLEILLLMPGNSATERELQSIFSEYHHRNEWYRYDGELKEFIEVNSVFFADYTLQFETDGNYQDERDWEYWKARAETAETALAGLRSKRDQTAFSQAYNPAREQYNLIPDVNESLMCELCDLWNSLEQPSFNQVMFAKWGSKGPTRLLTVKQAIKWGRERGIVKPRSQTT